MEIKICASYRAKDGFCFVDSVDDVFEMVPLARAKAPITCSWRGCKNPAVRLDHHYPIMDEMNRCAKHEHIFECE